MDTTELRRLSRLHTKRLKKSLHELTLEYWRPTLYYGLLVVFFGLLLWFQLGTLVGGYSSAEASAMQSSLSLRNIAEHPLNAPFALVAYVFNKAYTGEPTIFAVRAAATVIGLTTLTVFFWLVRHWHSERTAILGTVIFGCSPWFLHVARTGTPEVLLFLLFALVASSVWLKKTDSQTIMFVGLGLTAAFLYVPGMIWLLIAGAVWQGKAIIEIIRKHTGYFAIGLASMLALIAPLIWVVWHDPSVGKIMLGLPADGLPSILDILRNLAHIPYQLLWHGPQNAAAWLSDLPVLDAFASAMLVLGGFLYVRYWRLARVKMVAAGLVIGSALVALGGVITLSVIIPFVYLLIAAGIGFMLDKWERVFPRNIIAQVVAVAIISVAVIMSSWHGLQHYFVAWPSAPDTQDIFMLQ